LPAPLQLQGLLHDAVSFVYYGDPIEVLLVGVGLLLSANLIESATRLVENVLRVLGIVLIVVAVIRLAGFPLPAPPV